MQDSDDRVSQTGYRRSAAGAGATRLDLVHQGDRHELYRGSSQGRPFIAKRAVKSRREAGTVAPLRHEYEILRSLDLPGIVKAREVADINGGVELIMEDAGPMSLAEYLKTGPLEIAEFLVVSRQLADSVARMHAAQVIHRNIGSPNVVWDPETRKATLVDFAMATTPPLPKVARTSPSEYDAALSYIAPEQTGRTERSVDSRSDLYSLGATFYELLTGVPPFVAQDEVELLHAHLARPPRPPREVAPRVPTALSSLVLKLLEKEPERRYQTADALVFDLWEAERQWNETGTISSFELGRHDAPGTLSVPNKLYGRAAEIRMLEAALDGAVHGKQEVAFVSGAAGVGKSALVNQIDRTVADRDGLFVAGKFDQLQRGVPYSGLVNAFRQLVRRLNTEPEPTLAAWRERIQAAVAPHGRVLTDAIPELERLLGAQPPLAELGAREAKNRFISAITAFLDVFARPEQPLAIFLDDLQWIDAASLELIEQWIVDGHGRHLLLLGAYRDGEVDAAHPLARSLKTLREQAANLREIHLEHLTLEDTTRLIADTFNERPKNLRPLAELIVQKTVGNPFFAKRLLHSLHADKWIRFVAETDQWEWDLREIERAPVSDNVLELMVASIDQFPEQTKTLLEAGACIGHRFELGVVTEVMQISQAAAMQQLSAAFEDGILLSISETETQRPSGLLGESPGEFPAVLQFVHDKVQQAAYSLLAEDRRQTLHLNIGRHLLDNVAAERLDERLFDVVDQLCLGKAMITDPEERRRLAELGRAAGRKAKLSGAYQAAFDYLSIAVRQLPRDAWDTDAAFAFALNRDLAEAAYLAGWHDEAERLTELGIERAPSRLAKMELYSLRATAACAAGDNAKGLRAGREGLSLFGQEWPLEGLAAAVDAESETVMGNLGERRIDALAEASEPDDEGIRACIHLLSVLGPPAYFSAPDLLPFIVARLTNLSLVHGPTQYSAYGYTFYGALQNQWTGDYATGYAFGRLALALARRFNNRGEESRTIQVFGLTVHPWQAPLRTSLPLLREGQQAGVESGELLYVALTLCAVVINALPLGTPLAELDSDVQASLEFSRQHRNKTNQELTLPYRQLLRCLTGKTTGPASFEDGEFNESRYLEDARHNLTALAFYWINRLQAGYLVGDYETAQTSAAEAEKALPSVMGMIREAEYTFYTALTLAALAHKAPEQERATLLDKLVPLHDKLAAWAEHCAENFGHKEQLVAAELARVRGEPWRAFQRYRAALEGAEAVCCPQDQACAAELLADFLLAEGDQVGGLRVARDEYRKWGATSKVHLLEQAHPALLATEHDVNVSAERDLSIDTWGFIKATQAISAETEPDKLVERILPIVVEVAGAQSGTLLIADSETLVARGHATSDKAVETSLVEVPLAECHELPQALVRYVARLDEPLVLVDAGREGAFAAAPAVRELGLRSVLCVPLKRQGELLGILYLQNHEIAGAFTRERIEVVQALAAQAAASFERNAFVQEKMRLLHELQESDRRKDEFLATLAHELRNPLAPLRNSLAVMRNNDGEATAKAQALMERQLAQLTHLVDDLLDVSRITRGKIELRLAETDLTAVLQEAVETTRPRVDAAGHSLHTALPDEAITLQADHERLTQVLINLITNASKYTPDEGRIEVGLEQRDDTAVLYVRDDGMGIAAERTEAIFDTFVQNGHPEGQTNEGLGIGLTLVKQVVELHGGTVAVRSDGRGEGSTFTVRLPLPAEEAAATTGQEPTAAESASLRLLVVDDNPDVADSMEMLLGSLGHEVQIAHDGVQALETITAFEPDAVFLDLGLPGVDGFETAQRMRATPAGRNVYLIALTGWGRDEDISRSTEAGFDHHLIKPVEPDALEQFLAQIDTPRVP